MVEARFRAMGCEVAVLRDGGPPEALAELPAWFEARENALSRFRSRSALCQLNAQPGMACAVDSILWHALDTALRAAEWSDGLVLAGVAGRYHQTASAAQQLSWQSALAAASGGARWDEILDQAYGGAGFQVVGVSDAGECRPLASAENWLAARQATWKRQLAGTPGFESPLRLPRVCHLEHGNPYADLERGRLYATGVGSVNERLALTHEYLHFALANHPRGRDEDFVEQTARSLLAIP